MVHGRGADRSAVPAQRAGAGGGGERDLRAGRADGLAYASAGADAHRDGRLRRAQRWGGPVEELQPGDVVWFPPGEKHWHGAAPTTAMTHIAVQESVEGKVVDWLEQVSEEQYGE